MPTGVSERKLEEAIERTLLAEGSDSVGEHTPQIREHIASYGDGEPGGYLKCRPEDYDRKRCLIPKDLIGFIQATQPKTWKRLKQYHGADVKDKFAQRVARQVERKGTLYVLRNGIKDSGCHFELIYFRPVSGLNVDHRRLYQANQFSVVRQLRYSQQNENSLDMALFLNGLPLFTAELKNPFNGQTVENAVSQYRTDRDPREALFASGRCLAHFAVDPHLVQVTTRLQGQKTRFLPFNRGRDRGAGNPPVRDGYDTAYLWERIWAKDSVLNLIQHFVHEVEDRDIGKSTVIFPRFHQLRSVRKLVDHARREGTGHRYLIEHSAGSGKSFSIAWLAHQLSLIHDEEDERVFDSVVVISDRTVIVGQLQNVVRQFEQTKGMVENISEGSIQLKEALERGKNIVVTTIHKFHYIADQIDELPGKRFAVIVDEAHSSQSGEMKKSMQQTLATDDLEEAEETATEAEEGLEDRLLEEMRARGPQPNVSTFAFTATPKEKTLELFGTKRSDGSFAPFDTYSMRQAIEENFILDVLENYTTYETYWRLLKTAEDDPSYDKSKAQRLLKSFVDLHEHTIRQKVEILVEHFHDRVAHRIKGRAKAMIVTRSRLHAVRFKLALDRYLKEQGYEYDTLVAFSGTVKDGGMDYTEANMNGIPETQTVAAYEKPEVRFMVVAEKFQTGFDQPLLHTMYVDKKLHGVRAVQTLSRINRTHPDKEECMVLDFANEAETIQDSFQPYYEETLLSEGTDPNLLYDYQQAVTDFHLFSDEEMDAVVGELLSEEPDQAKLYSLMSPVVDRFEGTEEDEQELFRSALTDYVRLYKFLSQLLTFEDADLEKLYLFGRLLRRVLPYDQEELPREIQDKIDLDSLRINKTREGAIGLVPGPGVTDPRKSKKPDVTRKEEEEEPLSRIIRELNDRFGANLSENDKISLRNLEEKLAGKPELEASIKANSRENARLTFDDVATDQFQEMVESNFQLYKRVTDDEAFRAYLFDWLFERFRERVDRGDT